MLQRSNTAPPAGILAPQVSLLGTVDDQMVRSMLDQLAEVPDGDDPVTLEVTTLGGDAEMGRRAMLEVDLVVTADAAALARVWMGALTFADAMSSVDLRLEGRPPGCGNPYLRFVFSV